MRNKERLETDSHKDGKRERKENQPRNRKTCEDTNATETDRATKPDKTWKRSKATVTPKQEEMSDNTQTI